MSKNEKTSKRVAAIAGRIMAVKAIPRDYCVIFDTKKDDAVVLQWTDLRALAASALTQAADKPKKAR